MRLKILASVGLLSASLLVALAAPASAGPYFETKVVGHSVQGRPIVAYHLGSRDATPKTLLVGQIHGDEHAGVTLAESILHSTRSVEGINLWVVPTMNPDGDAAHTRQNAHGVDLNRNWPYNWAHLTGKYYSGPHPLSEPESQSMYDFLRWLHPTYLLVLHQPLNAVDGSTSSSRAVALRNALTRNLHLPLSALNCWSQCHGSMATWYEAREHAIVDTIEFGWSPSTSYLTTTARDGILSAIGGRWAPLWHRNPTVSLHAGGQAHGAHVGGWVFDKDFPSESVTYTVRRDGRFYARWTTSHPSPVVNARYGITGAHTYSFYVPLAAGRHTVCLTYRNLGAGNADPERCQDVVVG